jgi:Cof subfamily protein (haloacid dehalogenase superfamily)
MTAIRMLLADVDGTLLTPEKVLTEQARAAVRRLHEAGIAFAITSGRPPRGMSMLIRPLGLRAPLAAFNGGAIVTPELEELEERTIPPGLIPAVVDAMVRRDLDVWVYAGSDWLVRDTRAPHVEREQHTVQFPPTLVADFEGRKDVVKIVGVSDDLDAIARCEADGRSLFGDHVSVARSQPYYLDVTHPAANKGEVVRWMSARMAIPTEQIATIGDMPNDVLMFAVGGLSIAMGNASPEVRRCARRVTTSNSDEGFANAVERYVLSG